MKKGEFSTTKLVSIALILIVLILIVLGMVTLKDKLFKAVENLFSDKNNKITQKENVKSYSFEQDKFISKSSNKATNLPIETFK